MIWREFKAMGTDIIISALIEPEKQNILKEAENIVLEFEKRFSRFIKDNELTNFNDSAETKIEVTEMMLELLKESIHYFIKTKGIFDPTIIGSLEKVGYDKNFLDINSKPENNLSKKINLDQIRAEFNLRHKISDLKIKNKIIEKPVGFRVDFGGIGKGYITDFLSRTVLADLENFWISAGGDILAVGNPGDDIGWDIGVQNPLKPEENIFFINTNGEKLGIATSGIIKRSGQSGDFQWNHLIDPRSGLSVINNILSVTVISSSAIKADIYAKTILILGEEDGLEFIEREDDSAGLIFTKDNKLIFSKRADLYLKK
ncbi:MAG: FAD:protein FMN transferase [Patescibacteria group bacterium]